jgi:hypothetical protein
MIIYKCLNCGIEKSDFPVSVRIRKTKVMIITRCPNCHNALTRWVPNDKKV